MNHLHSRKCFFVTGRYEPADLQNRRTSHRMVCQMYVEELIPETITQPLPILFWPGTGSVGTCFVTTPDGRPGWSAYFLRHGFVVYLIDPPCRGRSAPKPVPEKIVHVDSNYAETFWTATAHNGGKWPQANLHSQWPGTGKQGDPAFDQFMASQAPSISDYAISEEIAQTAGSALLRQIGPAILCTHSAGASPGWLIADAEPRLVRAIIALEPLGPPFRNQTTSIVASSTLKSGVNRPHGLSINPLTYSPALKDPVDLLSNPPPKYTLPNLQDIPTLVVTSDSGYHVQYDHETVAFLAAAGVPVKHLKLADIGIRGNGHFMFLEKNSNEIAGVVREWLETVVDDKLEAYA